jgi:Leucine-rich repeat (LRR) protein
MSPSELSDIINNKGWESFLTEIRAEEIWYELASTKQLHEKQMRIGVHVHIELKYLKRLPQELIDVVIEKIIDYLVENEIPVKHLTIYGDPASGKQLHELPPNISKLADTLTHLDLSNNALTKLPEKLLNKMLRLQILDIHNNQLTTLPASFYFNLRLQGTCINARNNPWLNKENLCKVDVKQFNFTPFAIVFFASIHELSGASLLVPFKVNIHNMSDGELEKKAYPFKEVYVCKSPVEACITKDSLNH